MGVLVPAEAQSDLVVLNRRYRPALMSFFMRRVRNHAEADDLTQEVFLRIAAAKGGADMDKPDAYIFQTAANLLRDRGRRDRVRADYREGLADFGASDTLDPARILAGRESLAHVVVALRELGERTRAVFILYRLENMKQRDIADMFGISASAVEKHVVRAMSHLSRRLGEPQ